MFHTTFEPYTISHILIPFSQSDQSFNWELLVTCAALLISIAALVLAIRQTKMAEHGLALTTETIKRADTNRQLELLPKHSWIIHVHVRFNQWTKDIEHNNNILKNSIETNNLNALSQIKSNITEPKQLHLRTYEKEMPDWLLELYLSGAQYYFAGMGKIGVAIKYNSLNSVERAQYYLDGCTEDLEALKKLKELLNGMVPKVILNTPASVSSDEFFVD